MGKLVFEVQRDTTLEDFLRKDTGVSKRMISRLKRTENGITRNGKLVRTIDKVFTGDEIVLKYEDTKLLEPNGNLNVKTAFENENLIVFDKPVGMPVHPSIKHQGDTLGNFFAYKYPDLTFRPVNRLDRDTSGLCIVAKNAFSAAALQSDIKKVYYAVVSGNISGEGTIDAPIAREQESIIKRVVREDGQRAVTHYKALSSKKKYSLLEINLETGRTHQIRVHFAHIGHPLAGDDLYGGSREDIDCQALHCGCLEFKEPVTSEKIIVRSDLREDMERLTLL
ncbi:MAG: RluA family pseudouridine synthase [Oscillospiraceae bacterium]|nr:RluA family pseudouridine synthase [Oscillospiraceae bacterium]